MKKTNVKRILLTLLAVLLVMSVFAGCDDKAEVIPQKRLVEPSSTTGSSEYNAIFEGTNIIHFSGVFATDTVSYAMMNEDGWISVRDYAYKGDTVKEWSATDYIPVEGYSEEALAIIEESCKEDVASYDGISCAEASYNMGYNYVSITVKFTNVDDKDNLNELYEEGYVDTEDCDYLSMQSCEKLYLEEGYVKK